MHIHPLQAWAYVKLCAQNQNVHPLTELLHAAHFQDRTTLAIHSIERLVFIKNILGVISSIQQKMYAKYKAKQGAQVLLVYFVLCLAKRFGMDVVTFTCHSLNIQTL